jgi:hypothetical protein
MVLLNQSEDQYLKKKKNIFLACKRQGPEQK